MRNLRKLAEKIGSQYRDPLMKNHRIASLLLPHGSKPLRNESQVVYAGVDELESLMNP